MLVALFQTTLAPFGHSKSSPTKNRLPGCLSSAIGGSFSAESVPPFVASLGDIQCHTVIEFDKNLHKFVMAHLRVCQHAVSLFLHWISRV